MTGFRRLADAQHRARQIDSADLFCPEIVFRHEGEAAKSTQPPDTRDMIAGFLHHLAMQGGNRMLALVDTAAGQLILRLWLGLKRG
jgi:hypothetical protein